MKNTIQLLAAAALAAGASVFAQSQPAAEPVVGAGLLGQRYAEVSVGFLDVNKSGSNLWAVGADVNVPLNSFLDATVSWSQTEAEGSGNGQITSLGGAVTGFLPLEQGNTFGTIAVDYGWIVPGKDDWSYTIEGGYEYPVTDKFAARVSAGFSDDFNSGGSSTWDGTVKGIYKFSDKLSGTAAFSLIEGGHLGYTVGAVFKF